MNSARNTVIPDVIRFGPFEANTRTRELSRQGRRIKLPGLPFEVLIALLQQPGELVTREELQRRLWPDGTFVDFDNNINAAVTRLRQALGDSADTPQYVETLPRLGYRFIGTMETKGTADPTSDEKPNNERAIRLKPDATDETRSAIRLKPDATDETRSAIRLRPDATRGAWIGALVAALLVTAAVAGWRLWRTPQTLSPSSKLTILVLPFDNLTGDPEQAYISDGVSEEMITELARIAPARLAVLARTTAFRYKDSTKTVAEIAREVAADYVLEGSVRREGMRLRVTAQLIESGNQSHAWAASYDRDISGLLEVEREVAGAVAAAVRVTVVPATQPTAQEAAISEDARDAYLRARYFASRGTVFAVENALEFYQQAVAKAPGYALAHAGLARAFVFATRTEPRVALQRAREAASEARRLQPNLPEAELAWAMAILYADRDLEGAARAFTHAIALDAGNAEAHYYYAQCLTALGRFDEALAEARQAQALDPFSPLVHHYVGRILHFAGRNQEAIDHFARTLELEPNYPWALLFTANAWEDLQKYPEATAFRQKYWSAMNVAPDKVNHLGELYRSGGYPAVRREWIGWIEGFAASTGYVTSTELAMLYGGLGEKDAALRWLEKAFADQTRDLIYIRVAPELKPLHGDPRFDQIVARVFPAKTL